MPVTRAASRTEVAAPASSSPLSQNGRSVASGAAGPGAAAAAAARGGWVHSPTDLTVLWLAVSLPLVIWDTVYIMGRPHTMEGGWMHKPLWVPYKLYGEVDHVYGWQAIRAKNGFTAAQGSLNVVETAMYMAYAWLWLRRGELVATVRAGAALGRVGGAGAATGAGGGRERRVLRGRTAAFAVLLAFSAAVMTLSKTVLYWANEYFSGFNNVGHNSVQSLIVLWVIPNGAWLVLPTYMIYVFGNEIIDALTLASTADFGVKAA